MAVVDDSSFYYTLAGRRRPTVETVAVHKEMKKYKNEENHEIGNKKKQCVYL